MRIANNTMIYNFLSSLNKSQQRMNTLQEQLSDGKIVHRPSDDPVRAFRGLQFNVAATTNDQYNQNAGDGIQWLTQTDTSLQSVSGMMITAKGLVSQAISPNPSVGMQAIGEQLDGLINEAVTVANSQVGDRYIFAGQQDKVAGGPFQRQTITVGGVSRDIVVYKGDNNKISMPIQAGAADPTQDSVNVNGGQAFGPLTTVVDDSGNSYQVAGVFSDLIAIKDQIMKGAPAASNPAAGTATVSGTPATAQDIVVRVDSVNAGGLATAASYSSDGGSSWTAATVGTPGSVTLPNGTATLNIAASAATKAGDTYSFRLDPTSATGVTTSPSWLSNTGMADVDNDHERVLLADTQIGARMASYQLAQNIMDSFSTTIAQNQSANDSIDIAKATIDFKNNYNVYNAALAVGAQIMPPSLVDFLK